MKALQKLLIAVACGAVAGGLTWAFELQSVPAACRPCEPKEYCSLVACYVAYMWFVMAAVLVGLAATGLPLLIFRRRSRQER